MRYILYSFLSFLVVLFCNPMIAYPETKNGEAYRNNIDSKNYFKENHNMIAKLPMGPDGIVRLSKIEVYPQYIDEYMNYAREVGEQSLINEPGVLTMYAVADKSNPCLITILETYASQDAYKSHIASKHFQKYKQSTLKMVKNLVLSDQKPINPHNKLFNFIDNE